MNEKQESLLENRLMTHIKIFIPFDSVVALLTIVGNGIFMATLLRRRSLHTPPNVILGALCLSDLLIGLVVQPLYIIDFTNKLLGRTVAGFITIKTMITWFCVGLSFQHILLISLDRCAALCYPFWYHAYATCKFHLRVCILTSLLPIIVTTVSVILYVMSYLTVRNYVLCGVLFISLLSVAICNWKIFRVLRQLKLKITTVREPADDNSKQKLRRRKQERDKTYVIAIVVILFFICYLPLFVQFLLQFWRSEIFGPSFSFQIYDIWTDFFMLLNSVINPIVYYARMKEIRQAAASVLCWRFSHAVHQQSSV